MSKLTGAMQGFNKQTLPVKTCVVLVTFIASVTAIGLLTLLVFVFIIDPWAGATISGLGAIYLLVACILYIMDHWKKN